MWCTFTIFFKKVSKEFLFPARLLFRLLSGSLLRSVKRVSGKGIKLLKELLGFIRKFLGSFHNKSDVVIAPDILVPPGRNALALEPYSHVGLGSGFDIINDFAVHGIYENRTSQCRNRIRDGNE